MLSESQRTAVRAYIELVLPVLRLGHWMVELAEETAQDGKDATIHIVKNRYIAHLVLDADFAKAAPEEQRAVITHELVHIHHARLQDVITDLQGALGNPAYVVLWNTYDHEEEYITDALTSVLAPFLPLPEIPKE